jgi:amino acid adenylation domain-containing protein
MQLESSVLTEIPLSYGQRALWFLDRLAPGNPAYVIAGAALARGPLATGALEWAGRALVERHPALLATFHADVGGPLQRIGAEASLDFREMDALDLDASAPDDRAELSRRLSAVAFLPFDLERGPLLRLALFHLASGEQALVLSVHHIVADFWSVGVLLRELGVLYGRATGEAIPVERLDEPAFAYEDLAPREAEQLAGPEGERLWEFWRRALAGYPPALELPTDHPRPPVQTYRGGVRDLRLGMEPVHGFRRLARRRGATLYIGLLAAFDALLHRHSGQDRFVVGCPTTGRGDPVLAGVVGYLVNPVAIPADVAGDPTFEELLSRVRGAALAAFAHQGFPFPLLAERLQADRDPSRSPIFQTVIVLQKGRRAGEDAMAALSAGAAGARLAFGPLLLESIPLKEPGAQFDLSALLAESPAGLAGRFLYNRDLFEVATAERLANGFLRLLAAVAGDPERWLRARISDLPLLGEAERHQLLCDWNDTDAPGAPARVHELFFAQARQRPDRTAATWGGETLSRGELAARAERLAGRLRRLGVGPEVRVAICLGTSLLRVVAPLGVVQAGGAYVPLDPAYPAERLAFVLGDARPRVLLTERALAPRLLPTAATVLYLDELDDDEDLADLPDAAPRLEPESLAYVIYTSGSTGRPKGVEIPHAGLTNLARWHCEVHGVTAEDRATVLASPGFDASVWELWPYLTRGASLHLVDEETRLSPAALRRFWAEREVTLCLLPTPLAEAVLAEEVTGDSAPALRFLLTGGDRLRRSPREGSPLRLRNFYGPSEYSVVTTMAEVPAGSAAAPPIGRSLPNTRLTVLGHRFEPVPFGVPGELWIAGLGLARGYAGRPDLTAERFLPDARAAESGEPGARAYRTGDLVRYLPDGRLDFLARTDSQVKIRGFRIELGEIEAALSDEPGVREAVVVVAPSPLGEPRLTAWLTGEGLTTAALREGVARRLPAYMVPSSFSFLAAFPLSPSGKIDRRALAALAAASASTVLSEPGGEVEPGAAEPMPPRTPVEELLAGIWREVLGIERVGIEDSFFILGGHSLLATRVISRLREVLGVELPVRALFEAPTIAALAVRVEAARAAAGATGDAGAAGSETAQPIPRRAEEDTAAPPLSFAQERLWLVDQLSPGNPAYNLPGALRLRGAFAPRAFAAALAEVERRHEALRTVFAAPPGGAPVQVIRPPAREGLPGRPLLPLVDLALLPAGRRQAEADRLRSAEARRPFDLAAGPLLRAALLRLSGEEHAALVTLHHIVADGWSMAILLGELTALYTAFTRGEALQLSEQPLAALPLQYADFALWQRRQLTGSRLAELVGWWRGALAGAPSLLALPTDRPRPRHQSLRGGHLQLALPADLGPALRRLGQRVGTTLFMSLLAAFQALLARYTGQEDIPVGSPIAGRTRREVEGLIGFFVNTLVLRGDLSGRPTFAALLGRVREATLGAYAHQDLPFERLVEELRPERHLDHAPLFQVLFALQNAPLGRLHLPGVEVEPLVASSGSAKFDLTFAFHEGPDSTLRATIEYSLDLFDRSTAVRLGNHFRQLLVAAVAAPERSYRELPLLTEPEAHQALHEWNDAPAEIPGIPESPETPEIAELVPTTIAVRVARHPDAVALGFEGERMSYGELAARTGRLAGHLRALGVGPESLVGIAVERSFAMVAALLAIWEAGGAYLPLDPGLPIARQAFILADAGTSILLTQAALAAALPAFGGRKVAVEELWDAAPVPAPGLLPALLPDHPAYVIYTSGSTGKPKGVVVSHRALGSRLRFAREAELHEGDSFVQKTTISFDASIVEVFGPLLVGGTTVLARPGGERDPGYLVSLLRAWEIPQATFTMAMLAALLQEHSLESCRSLRTVLSGGEAMPPDLPALFYSRSGAELYNRYGPTEATISVTSWHCRPETAGEAGRSVPIGRPIARTRIYLLDDELRPVPMGVVGELTIAGACLARGYLNRPGATAEKFVPHPFGGDRMYRTGDLARFRTDGAIEFVGRIDGQVKIRGFRVELGEIEAALQEHPAVESVAVVDRRDRLLAYLVLRPGADAKEAIAEIRDLLKRQLPAYMMPAAFTVVPALPLSPTGKVDRKALPDPEEFVDREAWEAPEGPLEELVAGIWAGLLGGRPVGREDNFFDLGGHSLLATQVVSRVRDILGIELPLRYLFEAPTPRAFAAAIAALRHGDEPAATWEPRLAGDRELPLSFAQQRLWFLNQLEPESAAYNVAAALVAQGPIVPAILARTLSEVVRRHESLRTIFSRGTEGEPIQVILPPRPVALPRVELAGLCGDARGREVRRLALEEARRPFDLARGPLLRTTLLDEGTLLHTLLFNLHHSIADGWSMAVLEREVRAIYAAFIEGRPSPLPALAIQYADFSLWQRERLSGDFLAEELGYWRGRLAGAPALLELPTDRPRPPVQSSRGSSVPFVLPEVLTEGLRALCRRAGATPFMVLLAAWATLLSRGSGQDDVAIGSPIAGRNRLETEGLIGLFVNTLVLRADLSGHPGFRELLIRLRRVVLEAYAHQEVPFEMLVEALRPERSLSHEPLFQVMLNLHNLRDGVASSGLSWRSLRIETGTVQFDLTLTLAEGPERFAGQLDYRTDLFDRPTVSRLAGHFETLLATVIARCGEEGGEEEGEEELSGLSLLTAGERQQLLVEWGDVLPFPAGPCLHQLFAEQARRSPGAPAVVSGVLSLTYGQLDRRANRLARRLRRAGVGPEIVVGICLERSLDLVVAILGVLKAGGAYLPLDPAYPAERLAYLLGDAGAPVLVTGRQVEAALPETVGDDPSLRAERVYLEDTEAEEDGPLDPHESGASPENLAYVIYTSGSTGKPRGVQVTHANVGRLLSATAPWFGFGPEDVWTLFHSYAFDFSVWEIWGALAYGGTLVVVPYWVSRSPEAFHQLLIEERVTVLNQTPSAFRQLMRADEEAATAGEANGLALRLVIFGGEALEIQSLRPWVERHGADRPRLVNMYGITETTVHVTYRPLSAADVAGGGGSVLGRAIPDLGLRIVNRSLAAQPVGVPGELCILGPGLARGYLHRPERTAERFVPDPWPRETSEPGARLYRSGDLVRRLPDGDIEYLGRIDHQVKVRGFRIELGEIETALGALPGVRESVVIVREDEPGDRRLVAYVVGGSEVVPGELRQALQRRVPEPLVPSAIVVLDALPLTVNGKVDRRALPAPEAVREETSETPEALEKRALANAARTPLEEVLVGIWEKVLRLDRVGRGENFFELGGHSLLATQVVSRLRQALGVEIPLRLLFEKPTVAALAAEVEREVQAHAGLAAAPLRPPLLPAPREGDLPLSFAQQRLWFLDQLEPGSAAYNMAAAFRLTGRLEIGALAGALSAIVRRHENLRTTFRTAPQGAGEPTVRISPPSDLPFPAVDLRDLPEELRTAEERRLVRAEALKPFDLGRGPLLRATLLKLADGADTEHTVLLTFHHIVSDGWSTGVFVRELGALLAGSPLPELPVQYADFALWQRRWLAGDVLAAELAYWRQALADLSPLDLPTDRPRPPVLSTRGGFRPFALSSELTAGLARGARSAGVSLYMELLAVLATLLSRYTGREDLAIGSPVANRTSREVEGLIGFFVNTLVLRVDMSAGSERPTFRDLLARVRPVAFAAFAHQDLPFEKVVEELHPERDPSRTPLFEVLFVLQNAPAETLRLPGLTLSPLPFEGGTAKFDLTLILEPTAAGLTGGFEHNLDLFDGTTIERLAGHFATLAAAVVANPETPLAELPLLTLPERVQLLVEWSGRETAYPREASLYGLFADQAALAPDAVALVEAAADLTLSYGELDRRSRRLAGQLQALGVGPEVRVGLLLDRSAERVVATLAVLAAGGAYVPLDPAQPRERLETLLGDSRAAVVLPFPGTAGVPPASVDRGPAGRRRSQGDNSEGDGLALPAMPANALAYVMYTSGSTGVPKGVEVPQRAVVRLVRETDYARFDADGVFLQLAPHAFDAATLEIWAPLLKGGRLVMPPPGELSLAEIGGLLTRHGVTTLWLTAGLFHQMVDSGLADLAGVRQLLAGGDVLSPAHVRRLTAELPDTRLINGYGPTENTTFTCCFPLSGDSRLPETASAVPIGRPIANTRVYLLDRDLSPVPLGVPGELHAGGDGLARGYSDPAATAERFVPNPFEAGERLYRTGDLARFRADGAIEFLGRIDQQVKIRGFRIEPGEIEAVLGTHPAVAQAAVIVRQEGGEKRLVAYVVARPDARPETLPAELRTFLRDRLLDAMVPAAFVLLDALPLNANGKVDRRALGRIEPAGTAAEAGDGGAPRTEIEALLAAAWAEVLNRDRVGVDDDFFVLGGHSLLATQVISRVRQAFGVEVPLRALFERPTVAGLAAEIARTIAGRDLVAPPLLPVRRDSLQGLLPLSFAQQRLWFLNQLEPESAAYNIAAALVARGPLEAAVLAGTLSEVARRHEVLRTVFRLGAAGEPVQVIFPPAPVDLPRVDLSELSEDRREIEVRRLALAEARRPFDLARGPLLRASLLQTGAEEHVLLFNFHHSIADGWSIGVLVREVSAIYEAFRQGLPSPLPALAIQYADFSVWQRSWLSGDVLAGELAYWRERLSGAPALLELPTDRPRPPVQSFRGTALPFALSGGLTEGLRALSRRAGATPFMALLTAWATLLARYSGQSDVSVGSPIAGRNRLETEGLIGFFVNTLVLRTDLAGNLSFAEALGRVRRGVLEAYAHQDVPFEMLIEALRPERSLSYEPLFQVVLNLHNMPRDEMALSGLSWRSLRLEQGTVQFDLTLTLAEEPGEPVKPGRFAGQLDYRTDLFDRTTVRRLAGHLETLLAGVVGEEDRAESALSDLPLLTAGESQQLLAEWGDAGDMEPFPAGPCLHQLFEEWARRSPGAPAVVMGVDSLTYGQLDRRANRLARRLRRAGVGPEIVVGVCLERSLDLVVAILGVLKAGGAYLPLDPAYPAERLAYLLGDAGAPVTVTGRQVEASLPEIPEIPAERVYLEDVEDEADGPLDPHESGARPENLAYVIYTSGSTGKPRGVQVTHANVGRLLSATAPWFGFGPKDVWTLFHSYAFDFSVWEIWGALAYGGTLVVVPYWVSRSPESFYELLGQEGVTVLNQTPSAFRQLMRAEEEANAAGTIQELALRLVIFGGEALEIQSLRPWVERHGPDRPLLVNMYGITETTVHVTYRPLSEADVRGGGGSVIGRAIPDLGLRVVDRSLQPQPVGVHGELCISGAGLARGYLNRPELTGERFVPDPWASEPGARLYRSGDLVRRLPDGDIEYLGRIDHQVKVRGFRIELGEIEAALGALPGVREAVVIVREDEPGDRRLVAYVVGTALVSLVPSDLRQALQNRLPEPLVPSALVVLEALPLTVNGKVDRRALPAPHAAREVAAAGAEAGSGADLASAPRTPLEEVLAGIWEEVLRLDRVGREANFFELGGHSLLATQVTSRVRQALGVEIPLRLLFEKPTVAGLAAEVEREMQSRAGAEAPPRPPILPARRAAANAATAANTANAALPLSFAQQRLWFLDQLEPGSPAYNMPAAFRLTGRLDVGALALALAEIIRRHENLRTTFRVPGESRGEPVLAIAPPSEPFLPAVDLARLPNEIRTAEEHRLAGAEARRPFDLARGPLLRATLLRLAAEDHTVLLNLHHIVSDGWSTGVLVRELGALYAGFVTGQASPLPDLPVQYADFGVWQRGWLSGEVLAAELAYWRQALADLPPLDLPTDRPRPAVLSSRGGFRPFALSPEVSAGLTRGARSAGVSLFMELLAVFATLLARYTGHEDLAIGSPVANRTSREVEGLIGFFVNTLVLRVDTSSRPTFRELLSRVRSTAFAAFAHQDLPFEKVVEELHPERDPSRTPLFEVLFVLQNAPAEALRLPGLTLAPLPFEGGTAKFDLTLVLGQTATGLGGGFEHNLDLFDAATIDRMAGHFATLAEAVVATPEAPLAELPLLTSGEREQLLEWSGAATDYPREASLYALFTEQAALTPDAVAIVEAAEGSLTLTYAEVDRRSRQLAQQLQASGVGPEVRVGLFLDRSARRVVATLAVLAAGGAYVPLDPAYPAERLAFLVRDSAASLILTEESLRVALPETVRVLTLDVHPGSHPSERDGFFPGTAGVPPASVYRGPAVPADALAYVMYTSGSTGIPKGVAIPQRAVVRLVRETGFARFDAAETFLQLAPHAFDAATLEIWAPLLNGGRLVIPAPGPLSLAELGDLLARHGVSTLWLTAGLFHQMVEENLPGLAGLRQLLAGGDVLSPAHVLRAAAALPETRLINGYGPTENTTFTCCFPVPLETTSASLGASVPLGRPIANTWVYVLDRDLYPVPAGVPGELYAGGDGLARGYLGRPDLTAERFVPSPVGPPGARLYRTGDLARFRADGEIEFLGRIDTQVKIRGFRIEPGEVEAALLAHPEVRSAAVLARPAPGGAVGGKRLVAYVVTTGEASPAALHAFLRERLPEPLLPAAIVILEALPLTANGKLDRRALPETEAVAASGETAGSEAPLSPVQEMLAGIWAGVLGVERVGVEDDFFALGGHSLLATQLVSRVRAAFGVDLPLRLLFEQPTVAGFAREIEAAQRVEALPAIVPAPRDRDLPLSFAQQRLWFLDRLEPGRAVYNVPLAARLTGRLSSTALAAACNEIARRHEALRTTFVLREDGPVQVIAEHLDLTPARVDLGNVSHLAPDVREAELARLAAAEAERPFDLAREPLVRAILVRLSGDEHAVLVTFHHTVSDGWSMGVFLRELSALYQAFAAGLPSPLPELPIQYPDYAVWQRQWLEGEVLAGQLAFWRQRLAGAPAVLDLPTDRPRPAIQTFRGATESLLLPVGLAAEVERAGVRHGVTLFMLLLATFDVLLARHAGQEDIVVGTPVANRTRIETEGLIGFFVNTLVLRVDLAGEPLFGDLLGRVRETALAAYAHQDVPFERLVEGLAPDRSLGRTPLFQVMFAVEAAAPAALLDLPGLAVTPLGVRGREAKFDLGFAAARRENGLIVSLDYNVDLFDGVRMRRMLDQLGRLLAAAVADPEIPWPDLPLVGDAERHQLLSGWNDTRKAPAPVLLQELYAPWAAATPEAPALFAGDRQLAYGDLAIRVDGLARRLRALGVGPEVRVGILAEPSIERVVALLAVLTAGGAYVPLDPDHPAERTERILADAAVPVLLADRGLLDRHPAPAGMARTLVALGGADEVPAEQDAAWDRPLPRLDPDALAYVIYTSGSTGIPNGVLVRHGAAVNLISSARETYGVRPGDRVSHLVSFGFDAAVLETFLALASGAGLVIAGREERVPGPRLLELLRRREVSHLVMTPSVLSLLPEGELPALRTMSVGGESCPPELADRWASRVHLLNCYGPTETAIYSLSFSCEGHFTQEPPIGRPVANTEAYLLDRRQQPVPEGAYGELCLGGEGLARGYLGRPELTAARFVPDPWSGRRGGRLYRTGDLVHHRPDGNVEFLGRIDNQVKVRGLRIELGEIEAALRESPGVGEAAVVTTGEGGDRRLVAHVVPRPGAGEASDFEPLLRAHLGRRLPAYMVPSVFLLRESLPLTATGKLDRRALAALPVLPTSALSPSRTVLAPRDAVEATLVRLFAEVLGVPEVGALDSFFDLGGHSLLAVRLMAGIQREFGRELPLSRLFEAPSVERLAALLRDEGSAAAPWTPLVPLTSVDADSGRRPFFCVHPVGGSVFCYRELAAALGKEQPFYALQARGLASGELPFEGIEAMATAYLEALRAVQPAGPYLLGGWSFGGLVALEMACQLERVGERATLALLDPTTPGVSAGSGGSDLPEGAQLDDVSSLLFLARDLGGMAGVRIALEASDLAPLDPEARLDLVLARAETAGALPPGAEPAQVRRLLRLFQANVQAAFAYRAPVAASPIDLWLAEEGVDREERLAVWQRVAAGRLAVHTAAGDHYSLLREPRVRALAADLAAVFSNAKLAR